jgi:hypothetical protein
MPEHETVAELRARLVSLRRQRNRLAHHRVETSSRAQAEVQQLRRRLDEFRQERAGAEEELAEATTRYHDLESAMPGQLGTPGGDPDWRSQWEEAHEEMRRCQAEVGRLRQSEEGIEVEVEAATRRADAEMAERAHALLETEHEIERLMVELSRAEAQRSGIDQSDKQFREQLKARLEHLEEDRSWLTEEIAIREEQLRRVNHEMAGIRSLLELHAPHWAAASATLASEGDGRPGPTWKQAVTEILERIDEPLHYRALAERLAALGAGLGGQDPAETLLAVLSRDSAFRRARRGHYWLTDRPLPPGWRGPQLGEGRRVPE